MEELKRRILVAVACFTTDWSERVWLEKVYKINVSRVTKEAHIKSLNYHTNFNSKKVKFTLERVTKAHRGVEIEIYSFFNLGARWVGDQRVAPTALHPGMARYPFIGGWLCPMVGLDACGKFRTQGFYSQTVQPVASCYTDYAILVHKVLQFLYQTKYMSSYFLIVIPKYTFLNVFTSFVKTL
jgi:hypothetical protein